MQILLHPTKYKQEKEDGPLFKFYEAIMDFGGEFMQKVNSMKDVTLFAPSEYNPHLITIFILFF